MTTRPELLARAARHAKRYLDTIHERPVGAMVSGDALRRLLRRPLAEDGEDNGQIGVILGSGLYYVLWRNPVGS